MNAARTTQSRFGFGEVLAEMGAWSAHLCREYLSTNRIVARPFPGAPTSRRLKAWQIREAENHKTTPIHRIASPLHSAQSSGALAKEEIPCSSLIVSNKAHPFRPRGLSSPAAPGSPIPQSAIRISLVPPFYAKTPVKTQKSYLIAPNPTMTLSASLLHSAIRTPQSALRTPHSAIRISVLQPNQTQ